MTLIRIGLVLFAVFFVVGWLNEHGYWPAIEKTIQKLTGG